jgi:hypothetical protein
MIKKIPTVSRRVHPALLAAAVSLLVAGLTAAMLATR